jgi:hypothetical protein
VSEEDAALACCPFKDLGIRTPSESSVLGRRDVEIAKPAPKTVDDLLFEVLVREDLEHGDAGSGLCRPLAEAAPELVGGIPALPLAVNALCFGVALRHVGVDLLRW